MTIYKGIIMTTYAKQHTSLATEEAVKTLHDNSDKANDDRFPIGELQGLISRRSMNIKEQRAGLTGKQYQKLMKRERRTKQTQRDLNIGVADRCKESIRTSVEQDLLSWYLANPNEMFERRKCLSEELKGSFIESHSKFFSLMPESKKWLETFNNLIHRTKK